ncbi:hypothetical protein EMGBS15_16030 [Filimonas sp.]|nr:hypothetical protein EMGBS15_16030 [Filimonas sp.]
MPEYQKAYAEYTPYAKHATFYTESFLASSLQNCPGV